MAVKSIEATFGPNGEVLTEVHGIKGKGCEAVTKFIEDALGTVTERTHKAEYNQVEVTVAPQQKLRT